MVSEKSKYIIEALEPRILLSAAQGIPKPGAILPDQPAGLFPDVEEYKLDCQIESINQINSYNPQDQLDDLFEGLEHEDLPEGYGCLENNAGAEGADLESAAEFGAAADVVTEIQVEGLSNLAPDLAGQGSCQAVVADEPASTLLTSKPGLIPSRMRVSDTCPVEVDAESDAPPCTSIEGTPGNSPGYEQSKTTDELVKTLNAANPPPDPVSPTE